MDTACGLGIEEIRSLTSAGRYVQLLRAAADLATGGQVGRDPSVLALQLERLTLDGPVQAMAAIESLAKLRSTRADDVLVGLLGHEVVNVRRLAAWRLADRLPVRAAIPPLLDMLTVGGIDTMHAHETLRAWSERGTVEVDAQLQARLFSETEHAPWNRLMALSTDLSLDVGFPTTESMVGRGLRIAQLVRAAGLDPELSQGGKGDVGGVASLLVSLEEAFRRQPEVDHVLTFGSEVASDVGLFGPDSWEHLPMLRRRICQTLIAAGPFDVLHLRMADVFTLAGSLVAKSLKIPVCFSLAPDPHNVLTALERRGTLDEAAFLALDAADHLWFRARLIEDLATTADHLALFPGADENPFRNRADRALVGATQKAAVVAEGIDTLMIARARSALRAAPGRLDHCDVLDQLAAKLPAARRGLPIVVSVGRLNPVKGMDRVVAAWANDHLLADNYNLVIIGGDLESPSPAELAVLDAIDHSLPEDDSRRQGLVLLGGRPRAEVARVLASAAAGWRDAWTGGGIYVDGAIKEEFGLALLEAMASGLVVVAPSTGGPASYVDDGRSGILVGPNADLGACIRRAIGLVDIPGRHEAAERMVADQYSVDTMARQLIDLYQRTVVCQ